MNEKLAEIVNKLWLVVAGMLLGLLVGCAPEEVEHLDKAIVQDEQGRLYRLQHGLGDNFSILPLGTNVTFKK